MDTLSSFLTKLAIIRGGWKIEQAGFGTNVQYLLRRVDHLGHWQCPLEVVYGTSISNLIPLPYHVLSDIIHAADMMGSYKRRIRYKILRALGYSRFRAWIS